MSDKRTYDRNYSYDHKTGRLGFHVRDGTGNVVESYDHPDTARDQAARHNYYNSNDGRGNYYAEPSGH